MLRKICRISLISCLALCAFFGFKIMSIKVNAEDIYQDTIQIIPSALHIESIDGKEVVVDNQGKHYKFCTADGTVLNAREALTILCDCDSAKEKSDISVFHRGESNPTNTYEMSSYYAAFQSTGIKVTPYVAGPATITYGVSVTTNESFSSSMTIGGSLKVLIRSEFTATTGLTWTYSSSSSTSFSTTFSVESGKIGAVYFFPLLRYVIGYYYDAYGNPTRVDANYPIKLTSGFTDGLFMLIQN